MSASQDDLVVSSRSVPFISQQIISRR
uniref:Uncharacterized protein n=1 Tax=Arundo donax TaxID=35708 RepID=A0A0A9H4Y2_ARUDO